VHFRGHFRGHFATNFGIFYTLRRVFFGLIFNRQNHLNGASQVAVLEAEFFGGGGAEGQLAGQVGT
jgi:hypothetical protein